LQKKSNRARGVEIDLKKSGHHLGNSWMSELISIPMKAVNENRGWWLKPRFTPLMESKKGWSWWLDDSPELLCKWVFLQSPYCFNFMSDRGKHVQSDRRRRNAKI
jgi:hypothetical protein